MSKTSETVIATLEVLKQSFEVQERACVGEAYSEARFIYKAMAAAMNVAIKIVADAEKGGAA